MAVICRYEQYLASSGQAASGSAADAAGGALRAALSYVQRYNASALLAGGQLAVVEAWMHLVEVGLD